jgi:hypothetical protein
MRKFLFGLIALTVASTGIVLASDVGPKADVAAVRAALVHDNKGNKVRDVHVVGNYALLTWYMLPEGSGSAAYKRVSSERWTQLYFSGGAGASYELTQHGVPAAIVKQLCGSNASWFSSPC